jgi:hypothetical protein
MSRTQLAHWPLVTGFLLIFVACQIQRLQAKTLYVYDRDSLAYLSTDVAEVEIVRSYEANRINLIDVKVTLVHKGEFKKGQTVVARTDGYRKPKKDDRNRQPLAVGDHLVLFAVRAKPTEFNRIPEDAVIISPLPGGMRLVQEGYVFGFSQWDNPGPYVANVPSDPAKAKSLTVERFREKVRDSLRDTEEWARLVEAKQDKLDVPRLLKLLADRSQQTYGGRDYFTERICIRFAETHDLILLSQALPLAKEHHEVSILQCGFGTPHGRDYLLAKVNDAKEPMPARIRYSYALREAGNVYRSTFTEIRANGYRPVGEADEGNSGYITRIAKAASANGKREEICGSLVRCIDYFGQGIVQNKSAPLMADLHGAFAVLKELYDAKPSQEMQFAIEKATAWDGSDYEKLKSPCGTFISILRPVDPAKYTKPEMRSLIFEYEYSTLLLSRDTEVQPSVVLVHQGTQKRFVLPTKLRIRGWSTGGGSNSVVLPKDVPAGRYRVYFQISDGDKVISSGHHFAADL